MFLQRQGEIEQQLREKEVEISSQKVAHIEQIDQLRAEMSLQKQNLEKKVYENKKLLESRDKEMSETLKSQALEREGELQRMRAENARKEEEM